MTGLQTKYDMLPEPHYVAAECDATCDDPFCPYHHISGWVIQGTPGVFETAQDARIALAAVQRS